MKDMAIVGIAGEGFCTDHQAVLMRDRNAGFNAELVRLARLAFADTFDFRGMQCVEFVFVFRLLLVNPLYSLQQRVQMLERCGALQFCRRQFPLDLSQHNRKLVQGLLQERATVVDLPIPPRDGADRSSGRDVHEKNHQSAFKFPLIPSGFDANIIISQGSQRLLIRMNSNIYRVSKRFAGLTFYRELHEARLSKINTYPIIRFVSTLSFGRA